MKPDAFRRVLKAAAVEVGQAKDLLTSIGLVAQGNAQRITPVATGTLRRSLATRLGDGVVYIGTNLSYGRFVHDGTRYMEARPFLADGIANSRNEIEQIAAEFGAKVFSKVGKG